MRSLSRRFLLLPALSALAIAGCAGTEQVSPPSHGRADVDSGRGVILSQDEGDQLRLRTALLQEKVTRDPYGLLHVTVPMRATGPTQYLEYQYSFFDSNGTLVEGPMGWTRLTLEAGSPGTIQFSSTSPKAADFNCVVRYQR